MVDSQLVIIGTVTAFVVALVLVLTYSTWRKSKEGRLNPTNYRTFFIMGLIWFVVGSALMAASSLFGMTILFAVPLFALGVIYLIIAFLNKDKWRG